MTTAVIVTHALTQFAVPVALAQVREQIHAVPAFIPVIAAANPIQSVVDTFSPWIKSGGAGIALYGLISAGGKAARHLPNAGESFLMWVGGAIAILFPPTSSTSSRRSRSPSMSADAASTVRTSARYLNDRTRYPILLGRTVPQALGIGGGVLLLIAVWNLAAGLGWDGTPRVVHLVLLILAAAGPYQVATIFYSGAGEPYARQHVGFARRWLWRHARIAAGYARTWLVNAARTTLTFARTRRVTAHRAAAARPRVRIIQSLKRGKRL